MQNNLKRAINTELRCIRVTEQEQSVMLSNVLEGNKVKRRLSTACILTLVLILLAATALAATALTGHLRFLKPDDGPQPLSCTVLDDTLYIMTNRGLLAWQSANPDPVTILDDRQLSAKGISIDSLLLHADSLMLLDQDARAIWEYRDKQLTKIRDFEDTAFPPDTGYLADPVYVQGAVYIRAIPADGAEEDAVIWRINPYSGDTRPLTVSGVIELTVYRDGKLLALQRNLSSEMDRVIVLDAESGDILEQIAAMPVLEIEGVAYRADSDEIYALCSGALCRWNGTQWKELQAVTIPVRSFFFGTVGSGYVAAGYGGIQFISLDEEAKSPALTIRGWTSPNSVEDDFVQANPGIQIKREKLARFTGANIAAALEAGDTTDLFYVRLDATVMQLIRDGLLLPLSQSGIVAEDIESMLPQVQAAVAPSSTPYALPDALQIPLWMIRNDAAHEPPCTILELLSQDIAWNKDSSAGANYLANDYTTAPWTKQNYARYAITQAFDETAATGQIPDFNAKEFTDFLKALKNANLSAVSHPVENTLITANSFFMLRGRTDDDVWMQRHVMDSPAVTAAATDAIPSWLLVYVLNPNSQNMQTALDFLEYATLHRSAGYQALLAPASAKPCVYAYAQAPGFEGLLSMPDSWEVNADILALYQAEIASRLFISLYPYTPDPSLMIDTVMQYLDGGMTLEQCTEKLNLFAANESSE